MVDEQRLDCLSAGDSEEKNDGRHGRGQRGGRVLIRDRGEDLRLCGVTKGVYQKEGSLGVSSVSVSWLTAQPGEEFRNSWGVGVGGLAVAHKLIEGAVLIEKPSGLSLLPHSSVACVHSVSVVELSSSFISWCQFQRLVFCLVKAQRLSRPLVKWTYY